MREIPFGRPMIGQEERDAVMEVLNGHTLVHGPRSKQFEHDFAAFTGAPHAISVSSCTAGLHLCYFHFGIGPGDEVIVPAQTHTATAHAVALTGATPVFVDAEPGTGNIDPHAIEAAVTPRTRALSVVHYLGVPADMGPVMDIARKHDLKVVEDCALAVGSRYEGVHVGLIGDAGAFSFYPVKHMTTAEGGMVITRHDSVAAALERKRAFGVDRTVGERKMPGIYDVTMLGFNYRMNELAAAMGIVQVERMNGFLEERRENAAVLRDGLSGIDGISLFDSGLPGREETFYCISAILNDENKDRRPEIVAKLKEQGVGTSVYYPKPVPHMTYYREKYGYGPETFPVARRISDNSIALPCGPHLDTDDMRYIVQVLKSSI